MLLFVLGLSTVVHAQEQCSTLMQRAIELVSVACSATGRNQVCHGYFRVDAKDRDGDDSLVFDVGDIIPILDISALTTAPMNLAENEWGVALLRLQANLPDVLPGQNATFLLLGDSRIESDPTSAYAQPLQIFQLETGITGIRCSEGPADGLLVQTPEDMQQVKLTVNGVVIEAAGTAFVQAQPNKSMVVSALDGSVVVSLGENRQVVEVGTQVEIPMNAALAPSGDISDPVAFPMSDIANLPFEILPEPVDSPVMVAAISNQFDFPPISLIATLEPAMLITATAPSDLVATPALAAAAAPEPDASAPVNPQVALLLFSVAVLVSLLVILLVVIAAMIVRSVVRQIRQKREAEQQAR